MLTDKHNRQVAASRVHIVFRLRPHHAPTPLTPAPSPTLLLLILLLLCLSKYTTNLASWHLKAHGRDSLGAHVSLLLHHYHDLKWLALLTVFSFVATKFLSWHQILFPFWLLEAYKSQDVHLVFL